MMACAGRWLVLMLSMAFFAVPAAKADAPAQQGDSVQMMAEFQRQQQDAEGANRALTDKDKRRVMFLIGIPLLICILITAGLGIAMVVHGKQVFTVHMIFAGLSVTLAVVHVVVALVWFYPF